MAITTFNKKNAIEKEEAKHPAPLETSEEELPDVPKRDKFNPGVKPEAPTKRPYYERLIGSDPNGTDYGREIKKYNDLSRKNTEHNANVDNLEYIRNGWKKPEKSQEETEREDVWDDYNLGEKCKISDPEFDKIKQETISIVNELPFDKDSGKRMREAIEQADNAEDMFWTFFFNFMDSGLQQDLNNRFPGMNDKIKSLADRNAKFYAK